MNGTMHKWLLKSLGSLSLASTVVLLPMLLTGCGEDSSGTAVPVPPPPPPPAPPAPPAPTPTPTPAPVGRVISISPSDGSTNVSINTSIVIRFSEPVREAPLKQALGITSVAPQEGRVPPRDIAFNADRTEVTITFREPLSNDSVYRVTISRAVPDLFASGRSLPEDFVATFTTGNVAVSGGPISLLPTQLAALTPTGQVFSNPTAIPVGFGIRRAGAAENLPVGVYDDYRAVLSFPIPASIPGNAVVQAAQLTLVQLPSNDSATIPGFGNQGRGFFFLDPTPHNLPSNNVVFQEVTLGAPNNVVSSDFFAPASSPTFVALSINGNVLGGDVSAGPRTADVRPGVQRAVSAPGPRFYQVRLQCAKEVWNNQATPVFPSGSTFVTTFASTSSITVTNSVSGRASGSLFFQAVGPVTVGVTGARQGPANNNVYTVALNNPVTVTIAFFPIDPITVSFSAAGSTFSAFLPTSSTTASQTGLVFSQFFGQTISFSLTPPPQELPDAASTTLTAGPLAGANPLSQTFSYTASVSTSFTVSDVIATTSTSTAEAPADTAGFEISQGATGTCRAEFDKEPATGTGTAPITTARGPRLDITFTVPR
ncbi:Ig-like domain-containing protein [Synechococcus sp. 63AY4M2]|uniref:Ig-like domain-containing protein n=1 Tax=Synechococcus sp. 63AY4M2 TaxID=1353266 RepID=UPI00117FB305|nr:Ig-like domain-containing protein [Synechococcus sp. 63AY4M2]